MKNYKIAKNNKFLLKIYTKDILDESIKLIRENGLLIACYDTNNNNIFYERGKIIEDYYSHIYFEFDFSDLEDIYKKCIYECFFCVVLKNKIVKIKINKNRDNKFNLSFED